MICRGGAGFNHGWSWPRVDLKLRSWHLCAAAIRCNLGRALGTMTRHLLRAGAFGRFLKFLRKLLTRRVRKALEAPDADVTLADELDLLHTLCSVWIDGPCAQLYYDTKSPHAAAWAAREVRLAITASVIADCEMSLDHVAMLRRIEARLGSESPAYPSVISRFLAGILARVRQPIHAIQVVLPLRSPFG